MVPIKVMVCDSPALKDYTTDAYAKGRVRHGQQYKPSLLIGATNIGRDLGPRCLTSAPGDCDTDPSESTPQVCRVLKESSTIDLSKQKFDCKDRNLKMTRPAAFGGHRWLPSSAPLPSWMSTVRPGVMKKGSPSRSGQGRCLPGSTALTLTAETSRLVLSVEKAAELVG